MSKFDDVMGDIAKVAKLIEPAFAVLAVIQSATRIGGRSSGEVLAVIDAAIRAFEGAAAGVVTRDEIMAGIAKLSAGLVADDAATDAEIAARDR